MTRDVVLVGGRDRPETTHVAVARATLGPANQRLSAHHLCVEKRGAAALEVPLAPRAPQRARYDVGARLPVVVLVALGVTAAVITRVTRAAAVNGVLLLCMP